MVVRLSSGGAGRSVVFFDVPVVAPGMVPGWEWKFVGDGGLGCLFMMIDLGLVQTE